MQSKNPLRHLLAMIVLLVPLAYLGYVWNELPPRIALHFGASGQANGWGDRNGLLVQTIIVTVITLVAYIVVVNAHKLDKKRTHGVKPPMFDTIAFVAVLFMSIISLAIIINGINPDGMLFNKIVLPATGMFFIFIGNVMYSIRPNRFVGVRIPWTLNNDDNWKHTHRLAGKLFFAGGLMITFVSLVYKTEIAAMFMSGIVLIILVITVGYSYNFYRTTQKNKA